MAASTTHAMTLMVGASTLCLPPLPFPVHVPQGFERFSMISANGCPAPITPDEVARIILGNITDQFERLRGVPGFQLDPVPWKTVKHLVAENTTDSLGKLGRSPAGQVIYWKFKTKVGLYMLAIEAPGMGFPHCAKTPQSAVLNPLERRSVIPESCMAESQLFVKSVQSVALA